MIVLTVLCPIVAGLEDEVDRHGPLMLCIRPILLTCVKLLLLEETIGWELEVGVEVDVNVDILLLNT